LKSTETAGWLAAVGIELAFQQFRLVEEH